MEDHKRIPDSNFIVDYFVGDPLCDHVYFLTHYHSDHYGGIRKSFNRPIYCSETTGNLLCIYGRIEKKHINILAHNKLQSIGEHYGMAIDANHCPGASMFIFFINGRVILHTGDFRADNDFLSSYFFKYYNFNYEMCFIDNTYEGKKDFQSQKEVIFRLINYIRKEEFRSNYIAKSRKKYFFSSYLIGKEKIFFSVAQYFNWKIEVDEKKFTTLKNLASIDWQNINIFVLKILEEYTAKYGEYEERKFPINFDYRDYFISNDVFERISKSSKTKITVLNSYWSKRSNFLEKLKTYEKAENYLIIPRGWNDRIVKWRVKNEKITVFSIPYSEHSSAEELIAFKKQLQCKKYINTVHTKKSI